MYCIEGGEAKPSMVNDDDNIPRFSGITGSDSPLGTLSCSLFCTPFVCINFCMNV